jgi:hypothetical protein
MTWLGKILAMLVMILSLVWMYFTVNAYVTRTNWKTQSDKYKAAHLEALAARESEHRLHQSADEAYARKLSAMATELASLKAQNETLLKANADNVASMKNLASVIDTSDIKAQQLQTNLKISIQEAEALRDRANKLDNERITLVVKKEQAEKERLEAQNDMKLALSRLEGAERLLELAQAEVKELKAQGGAGGGSLLGRGAMGFGAKDGPAPLDGTRGTVTSVDGDLLKISLGLDAGLKSGMVLDVSRTEGGGKYLGTITILAGSMQPKQCVGMFKSADGRPMSRLRADELPKVGDQVKQVETSKVSTR